MVSSDGLLKAGVAKVDISPALGIQIAGDIGRRRPCTGVAEPISPQGRRPKVYACGQGWWGAIR